MTTPTMQQKIEYLYTKREYYDGYMRTLIELWKRLADTDALWKIGHNAAKFLDRAYYGS